MKKLLINFTHTYFLLSVDVQGMVGSTWQDRHDVNIGYNSFV